MAEETCDWTGISGRQYTFRVLELSSGIDLAGKGNYIYAKPDAENTWRPIHVGHGDLILRCTDCRLLMECIKKMGATHVHLRPTPGGEETRKAITRDLLARYSQAYAPLGCTQPPEHTRQGDQGAWLRHFDDRRRSGPACDGGIEEHD